jgi:hypothetical protein
MKQQESVENYVGLIRSAIIFFSTPNVIELLKVKNGEMGETCSMEDDINYP